jgi:hypothetical protein
VGSTLEIDMANTLTTAQKALILLADDSPVTDPAFHVVSSDTAVCTAGDGGAFRIAAIAQGAGVATLTATRLSDGAVASLDVTVSEVTPGSFEIHLGAPSPK